MSNSRDNERILTVDASDPNRGRFDPARFRRPNPDDKEPRPVITPRERGSDARRAGRAAPPDDPQDRLSAARPT
jgi:hypothetical protein